MRSNVAVALSAETTAWLKPSPAAYSRNGKLAWKAKVCNRKTSNSTHLQLGRQHILVAADSERRFCQVVLQRASARWDASFRDHLSYVFSHLKMLRDVGQWVRVDLLLLR